VLVEKLIKIVTNPLADALVCQIILDMN